MRFARLYVGLISLTFVGVGIAFLLAPLWGAGSVDLVLPTATARTDVRATYGGLDLGFGLFLAACSHRNEWVRPGLLAVGLALGGFAAGRLVGLAAEGGLSGLLWGLLAIELPGALLAFYLYQRNA
jgi:hypothetical protein